MASKPHWTEALQQAILERGQKPEGKGWATFREIKTELKRGDSFVHSFLNNLARNGKCEVFRGTEVNSSGCLYRQTWYRLTG